jgi:thiamine-monophosphate kinase
MAPPHSGKPVFVDGRPRLRPMSVGEFDLIQRWFTRPVRRAVMGVGDDCALLQPTPGMQLVVSSDMLVEGRHFLSTVAPDRLGHKALAVNLSDLAACGASPLAFTLALSMPRVDETFLDGFARGLYALADAQGIELVGGDTTAGPLNICITVFGEVPPGQALLRSGARAGDQLWVSGTLGDARLALEAFRGTVALDAAAFEAVRLRMELPTPRVALGIALRGVATSAIDLSDGLLGDLGHVLARSKVGAKIDADALPTSRVLASQPLVLQRECLLSGGDDYELLFTAPAAQADRVRAAAASAEVAVTCIGRIDATTGVRVVDRRGHPVSATFAGFDHFKN